jgi:hypothetical protein
MKQINIVKMHGVPLWQAHATVGAIGIFPKLI